MTVQILIVNTAFYIYGNIRLKEISILNSFEQVQENIIADSAFSARLGSSAGVSVFLGLNHLDHWTWTGPSDYQLDQMGCIPWTNSSWTKS